MNSPEEIAQHAVDLYKVIEGLLKADAPYYNINSVDSAAAAIFPVVWAESIKPRISYNATVSKGMAAYISKQFENPDDPALD